jgi:hypothetical protein
MNEKRPKYLVVHRRYCGNGVCSALARLTAGSDGWSDIRWASFRRTSPPTASEEAMIESLTISEPQHSMNGSAGSGHSGDIEGVYSFDALQELKVSLEPCIEGIANEGQIVVLAGSFAIGKTLFSLQMSIALAIGHEFVGRKLARPRTVAYLDMEDGAVLTRSRLEKQIAGMLLSAEAMKLVRSNWLYLDGDAEGPLQWLRLNNDGFKKLQVFVQKHKTEVLVLDNFGRVFPGKEVDEHNVRAFFADLTKLRTECPSLQKGLILLPHHVTKPSLDATKSKPSLLRDSYEWLSRVRGSGRILDFSQVRLGLDAEELAGDRYYVLNGVGKSVSIQPLILERDPESLIFDLNQDKDLVVCEVFSETPKQKELFDLITTDKPIRHKDLKEMKTKEGKQFQNDTISQMLKRAVNNKLLEQLSDGSYRRIMLQK